MVGFSLPGLPAVILLPLCLLAGAAMGAFYAAIAGYLRAATGAHEVISTIMLNLTSYRILDYMLRQPWVQKEGRADPISKSVPEAAELPRLLEWLDPNLRVHAGLFLMLIATAFVYWLLFRTKVGFSPLARNSNPTLVRNKSH